MRIIKDKIEGEKKKIKEPFGRGIKDKSPLSNWTAEVQKQLILLIVNPCAKVKLVWLIVCAPSSTTTVAPAKRDFFRKKKKETEKRKGTKRISA